MPHTTALPTGHRARSDTALKNLRETTPLIIAITQIIPGVVLHELAADGPGINLSVESEARDYAVNSWRQ